jgi:TPR repeat protein
VEANDAGAICEMGTCYYNGLLGFQQDETKAIEQWMRAAELGFSKAHGHLGNIYHEGGDMRKAKFHMEAAAMAGNEVARCLSLEYWRRIPEIKNKLLCIGRLQHQLGVILLWIPCKHA